MWSQEAKRSLQTSQGKVWWKKMSLKAGEFLTGEEEEGHSKREDCRRNNGTKRYFERKIDRNWWYIGYESVTVRAWSRGRGVENHSKGLRLLIGERGYCWCNGRLRKENRLTGRVGLLNKIFFLL